MLWLHKLLLHQNLTLVFNQIYRVENFPLSLLFSERGQKLAVKPATPSRGYAWLCGLGKQATCTRGECSCERWESRQVCGYVAVLLLQFCRKIPSPWSSGCSTWEDFSCSWMEEAALLLWWILWIFRNFNSLFPSLGIYAFGLFATDIFVNAGQVVTGNLAPHFLALCKPNYTALGCKQYTQFISSVHACTGNPDLIMKARKTFPSKEAALSIYAAMYLAVSILYSLISLYFWEQMAGTVRGRREEWAEDKAQNWLIFCMQTFCELLWERFIWLNSDKV